MKMVYVFWPWPIKKCPPSDQEYKTKDEHSLVLMGFLAFLDPPKQTAKEAISGIAEVQCRSEDFDRR